jgi:hypothetical protein
MNRRWAIALLLLAAVLLGAGREFIFINLNYQLDHVARGTAVSYAHSAFQRAVSGMDVPALARMKWGMAALFISAACLCCLLMSRMLFGSWRYTRTIVVGYAACATFALLCHGFAFGSRPMERLSIQLLHAAQYPVPVLFLLAAALSPRLRSGRPEERRA